MGRPPMNLTPIRLRIPSGWAEHIDLITGQPGRRSEFIRTAIRNEIERQTLEQLPQEPKRKTKKMYQDVDPLALAHSARWRRISNRFPRRVWEAYEGDVEQALKDSDNTVLARVRDWEIAQGLDPVAWIFQGQEIEGRNQNG